MVSDCADDETGRLLFYRRDRYNKFHLLWFQVDSSTASTNKAGLSSVRPSIPARRPFTKRFPIQKKCW